MTRNITIEQVDPDGTIWRLFQRGPLPVNIHAVATDDGVILIDTGNSGRPGELAGALATIEAELGQKLSAIALTHAHPDHCGATAELAKARDVPVYTHAEEVPFLLGLRSLREVPAWWGFIAAPAPPQPLAAAQVQLLPDGGRAGPLLAVHTPGHTPGHLAFYHARAATWFSGDVVISVAPWLHGPLWPFTYDIGLVRRSAQRLLEHGPFQTLCMGHGRPVRDRAETRLRQYLRRHALA